MNELVISWALPKVQPSKFPVMVTEAIKHPLERHTEYYDYFLAHDKFTIFTLFSCFELLRLQTLWPRSMVVGQPVVLQGQAVGVVSIDPKVSPAPIKAEVINNEVGHAPTFCP